MFISAVSLFTSTGKVYTKNEIFFRYFMINQYFIILYKKKSILKFLSRFSSNLQRLINKH